MLHNEARELLVKGYERTHDAKTIALSYGISERQVYRIIKQQRETGSVKVQTSKRGRKPKLGPKELEQLDLAIQETPDATLGELIKRLDLDISESNLSRIVREKLGYSLKKKMIHASEQERPRRAKKAH